MASMIDRDGLLQQPVEELSPAAGCPSVKPEHELIKIMIQIPMRYTALMDPEQPPLKQGRGSVNTGEVHQRGCTSPAIQDRRAVCVAQTLQTPIAKPAIGDDHAAPGDVLADEFSEHSSARISDSSIRMRPICSPRCSAATPTRTLFRLPPTSVSSTSTLPLSCSRPGRTIARRSLWSIAHAVS